ncbi:hypothetical protein GOODEAATRI_004480 [Goodea atripinnis]|uniref:Stanniocalcin n=1 Tax=Goodea atripinnis TaxID=208336 RepID=A0ABV0N7T8_9TELE
MGSDTRRQLNRRFQLVVEAQLDTKPISRLSHAVSHLAPLWQSEPWHDEWCNNTQHSMGACIAPLAPIDIQKLSPKTYQYLQVIGNIEKPVRQYAMLVKLAVALMVLSVLERAVGSDNIDFHELPPEKPTSQKGRLSLQNTGKTEGARRETHCLVSAGDVGCGVFECFENNSCEIRGLQEICMTFLHNAGKFDSQGKSFIKDALKCMAHGLRHKFSCISRKCVTIKEMVFQLQRECYIKHNLCSAAKENVAVMVEMIHFQDLFPKGPYVELVNILLNCGEEVKEALTRSVRLQCEQNWGALCDSLSLCSSLVPSPASSVVEHHHQPFPSPHLEPEQPRLPRQGDKDRAGKAALNAHLRHRSHGPRRHSPEAAVGTEQEDPKADIRR